MTKLEKREVRMLLDFAPVDAQYERLKELYLRDFHSLSGLENFVQACGHVEAALEVLNLCNAKR